MRGAAELQARKVQRDCSSKAVPRRRELWSKRTRTSGSRECRTPGIRTDCQSKYRDSRVPDKRHRRVLSTRLLRPPSTPRAATDETVDDRQGTAASRRPPPELVP